MASLRLNSTIPNFTATSTIGELDYYDYVGDSWSILFSHPLDFTPVCTTELGRIIYQFEEFRERNVKVIGLSCDDVSSHIRWIHDIKSYCLEFSGDFPYPIIADPSRELAMKLDMLDTEDTDIGLEEALTVRSLYLIDPMKKLRLSMIYPVSTGRDIDEILRVIDSLQLVDKYGIIETPVNWIPGTKILVDPTATEEEIRRIFPDSKVESTHLPSDRCYMRSIINY
ncbi:peroxiredoxin-6-like [Planococcus citri]|uniref:peroxiredoxin-6-like n=1 Tax=Planococcus citri TaxID=170843 RepID=UPI0031F772BA